ncbi:MAG TPA: branched-chain amino acid ABC transporter ATP-binding protein/permease [Xanthobacteraceae bacterium]|nr:branched-chain amino acid ABC transporter ATP-binding protein/permease [Xanthobacteraceae bacterium]
MLPLPRPAVIALLAALFVVALALPLFVGTYGLKFTTRVMVLAIFVLSLDFLIGITGLVSFGHAMFFGLGAYTVYFLSPEAAAANALLVFPLAVIAVGIAAMLVGALAVLTRGFYFIMVTLAFGEMMYSLFHDTRFAGGSDGAYINVKPAVELAGVTLIDFEQRLAFYYFCLALLVLTYGVLLALARGPVGRVLQGIRWNEERIGALGFNTYTHKLASFTVAGAIAGLAGALFATIDGYVTPDLFGWRQSGLAIMMVVLGGVGTLFGSILGATVFAGLEELLKTATLVGPVAQHWSLALGLILIVAVLAAPRGIGGALQARSRASGKAASGTEPAVHRPQLGRGLSIAVDGLTRRFGGLTAVDDVTLRLAPNKVHGIIGPNGAGKTTFINLLSGALKPSAGRIVLEGEDVTGKPAYALARRGIGRSYQITNVLMPFTVRENCLLAAQAHKPSPLRLFGGKDFAREEAAVAVALVAVGLADRAETIAAELSHGEQRQLEIGMLLASGARLLILDEPLAGMGPEETDRVIRLLRALATDHTVILIEHDIDAIFAAADTLTVLVGGRLLAHGLPEEVRNNAAVREAYLGNFGREAAE